MKPEKTLHQLAQRQVSLPKAYMQLSEKRRPARFVKIRLHQDDRVAQRIINSIFFFPLPIRPVFFFVKRSLPKPDQLFFKDMLVYAKDIKIDIESEDTRISIRVY